MTDRPHNFLGLEPEFTAYEDAAFAVLPVPYEATTTFHPGTRNGPTAIITASQQVETFDEELEAECYKCGIATLDAVEPDASGPQAMHEKLFKIAKRILRDGKFLFALGGEHGITSAFVRAAMTKHPKLSVLQIDAHCDLRNEYEGSPYSHACVMRRVHDLGATIVPVGIRNVSAEEHRFMKKIKLEPITAVHCFSEDDGIDGDENWLDRVLNALGDDVYITIDIDGFDPAYAPGTGTPEPGGLDWYQVTGLLRLVAAEKNVVAADIVEVSPVPGQVVTEFLAARLAHKLMCFVQMRM